MLPTNNCDDNLRKLRNSMNYMKDHDISRRLSGIGSYFKTIQSEYQLLSLSDIKQIQVIFECENNNDVLIELSRLCTKIALVSFLKKNSFEIDIILNTGEVNMDYIRAIIREEREINIQDCNTELESHNLIYANSLSECIKNIMDVVTLLVPILQDIAEVDDVIVRSETLKSLKLLMNIITLTIEDYIEKKSTFSEEDPTLVCIFNQSIDIFEKLSSSDILSHKILSCHIIPLILRQKRLYDHFNDQKNILISNYTDFCTHPAPILRKHASNVFNYIMDEIEFNEEIVNILFLPMIKNFCFDEQDCVRLSAISNIESFFFQTVHIFKRNNLKLIFFYYDLLQPLILKLCSDDNWKIRSSITLSLINIFIQLIHLENDARNKYNDELQLGFNEIENSVTASNNEKILRSSFCEKINFDIKVNELQELDSLNNIPDNKLIHNTHFYEEILISLLNKLITDSEVEARNNSISTILEVIEKNCDDTGIIDKTMHNILFYKVIIPKIENKSLLVDADTYLKINLTRVITIIMKIHYFANIVDKALPIEGGAPTLLSFLLETFIYDKDAQVRQSVLLALYMGMMEWRDRNFIANAILPYLNSTIRDNQWRIRYCSIILLLLSLYSTLECSFNRDDIWSGQISKMSSGAQIEGFLKSDEIPNTLLELIFGSLLDRASIIRQITCIFVLPLISFWFGHDWTKSLWKKLILPLVIDHNSYLSRSIGLLSANSIIVSTKIRSFDELKRIMQLISQLIFNLLPNTENRIGSEDRHSSTIINGLSYSNSTYTPTEYGIIERLIPKEIGLETGLEFLSRYLPLIKTSNLVLSHEPFVNMELEKEERSADVIEFHNEIISTICKHSIKDSVSNVRIKAFQVIHSFICNNGLDNCDKSIIDQVVCSHENDPDPEIRNYCLSILENDIGYKF